MYMQTHLIQRLAYALTSGYRLHMDELQTLQQCLEECRQQKSCFPFAETLAKIATWVHSVREDMQATDSSRGPVARD